MGKVIGIIAGGCPSELMMGLTRDRPLAALPFGGRYRLLDFPLSNLVNSGLRTVGIITPFHYRSVLDHLGAGKEWLLDRKTGGLFILPGYGQEGSKGKFPLQDLAWNADFLYKDQAQQVIITCSNLVLNIDFTEVLDFHHRKNADVTLIYKEEAQPGEAAEIISLEPESGGRVKAFGPRREPGSGKVFLDMLIIQKELLLELLEDCDNIGNQDLLVGVSRRLNKLQVYAYEFSGYVGRIDSVAGYFACSMDLLKPEIQQELFRGNNRIHTKIADNPPTRYGHRASVKNSLIASGCKIDGEVENSIIFRQVQIKPGAKVKNSIIMQKCIIGRNVTLDHVILDKFVRVKEHTVLEGQPSRPVIVEKTANWVRTGGVSS